MVQSLIFSKEMLKRGFDFAEYLAEILKEKDWAALAKVKDLLPYCFVQLRCKEFELKPDSPESSKLAADQRMEAAKQFAQQGNSVEPR